MVKKFWILISLLLLIAGFATAAQSILFVKHVETVAGTVESVRGENIDRPCPNGRTRGASELLQVPRCTLFFAKIRISGRDGDVAHIELPGGFSTHHDRPADESLFKIGQQVPLMFHPNDPHNFYLDSGARLNHFVVPFTCFFLSLVSIVTGHLFS